MEEWPVESAATGAFGPAVAKLISLLGDEYKLLEESRSDIEFIKSELERMAWDKVEAREVICKRRMAEAREMEFKRRMAEAREMEFKKWMAEARDLSYHIDDSIDRFMLGLERGQEGFVQKAEESAFQDLKEKVQDLGSNQWMEEWMTTETVSTTNRSKPPMVDPRARFLHENEWELMEMEDKKNELIELLMGEDEATASSSSVQRLRTVCIVGFAGMGKTTLADQVYSTMIDIHQFKYRAFVSVSPDPNMMEILSTVFRQVSNGVPSRGTGGAATEQHLISEISKFLEGKRYLVVLDDIWHWEEWEIIRKAFPKNNLDSKIILTTRITAIAEKCGHDEDTFIYKIPGINVNAVTLSLAIVRRSVAGIKIGFGEDKPCHDIVQMCRGMPLALVCMSSALAERLLEQDDDDYDPWESWWSAGYILDNFLSIPSLKTLVESLSIGYNDLPVHLRTCLLYCSIYPSGHKIERHHLVRKWIAEGFVYQEEAAEAYFDKLISRNLLHPAEGRRYEVHPVMLAFLRCKSNEANFVTCGSSSGHHTYNAPYHGREIRRLSLGYRNSEEFYGMKVSRTRSLVVFGATRTLYFKKFKRLRVLDLEYSRGLKNADLLDICELVCLRYLGLKGTSITELPREIGRLQNLVILDVRNTGIRELPLKVGHLPKLLRALASTGVMLPKGLLVSAVASKKDGHSSQASLLAEHSMVTCDKFGLITEPQLGRLNVAGRHVQIPQYVKDGFSNLSCLDIRLGKLDKDDFKFLQEMPNLLVLTLRFEALPKIPIPVAAGGFPRLQGFRFDCRLPQVAFQRGAMPKLKYLEFKFYAGPESQHPVGITHLQSLQRVIFRCSTRYRSDGPGISATITNVRREAEEHCNRISVSINGSEEVFPAKKITDIAEENSINGTSLVRTSPAGNGVEGEASHVTYVAGSRGACEIEEIEEAEG